MPVKLSFRIDERIFMAKIKGVGKKVIPYIKADIRDLAKWAFKEVKKGTPETSQGRTKIKDLWVISRKRIRSREQFIIKNLYHDQDILWYMEKGTESHIITPSKPGGFLHFVLKGNDIFTRMVKHPGTKAYKMVENVEVQLEKKVDWITKRFFMTVSRLEAMGIK